MDGYWVGRGTPSAIDWCEPNYVVTPYIAEFFNTLTSLPMAAIAAYGLWRWYRSDARELRFAICFGGLLFVGLGSVAFHGTLLRIPQAMDELPMVYVGLVGAWCVRFRGADARAGAGWAAAMAAYAAAFTLAYAWAESYFEIFIASYALLVTYMAVQAMRLTWFSTAPRLMSWLLLASASGFLGSLAFFWIPEHVLLGCDHWAQGLHLHSWWHLGSGSGTYAWFLWAIADRQRVQGKESRWDAGYVLPA